MTKSFKQLTKTMSAERKAKISARIDAELKKMPLQELRQALKLTQVQVAETLTMNQAAISKMEKQTDMYVSTLRRFIEAMGGDLEIVAHFPNGAIAINQFEQEKKSVQSS